MEPGHFGHPLAPVREIARVRGVRAVGSSAQFHG
jgi:hypothetical protein